MEIHRFFVSPHDINNNTITVSGEEYIHMTVVLRHKIGYKVIVNCDNNIDYFCEITAIDREKAVLIIEKTSVNNCETYNNVTLYVAISKADKIELICQKAVELGVKRIVPFTTQNSEKTVRLERLNKIMLDAAKQCERAKKIAVEEIFSIDKVKNELADYDIAILFYEKERNNTVKLLAERMKNGKNFAIIIGAEGGFTEYEVDEFVNCNAIAVTLGRRILRTETAAIAAISLCMYELGEMQ